MRTSVDRITRETSEAPMIDEDEQRRDLDAFRPFDDVHDRRVDEDERDDREPARALWPDRDRHGNRGRRHQHEHAGRVGAALRVDVGVERDRHDEADRRDHDHERTRRARPVRRHAVPRQIARHEIEQPGHRRRPGEPENRNRRQVVERAEDLAEVAMRQVRQARGRPPVRPSADRRQESSSSSPPRCR